MNAGDNLRIGLLLDSWVVPAWIASIVDEVLGCGFCEIPLVVLNGRPRPSWGSRLRKVRGHLLYYLYERLDRRVLQSRPDAFAPADLRQRIAGAQVLTVRPENPKPWEDRFATADLEAIRTAGLDVLFRFGFNIIRGGILEAARCGVWSFHHGDNREYRGGPALFWEIHEGNPVSGTVLQVLTKELDGGHVIYRSSAPTYPFSLARNRNATYWKTARFAMRRLRHLHDHGWDWIRALPEYGVRMPYERRLYRMPGNREMAVFLWRLGRRMIARTLDKLARRDEWVVAYRRRPAPDAPPPTDLSGFQILRARDGHWLADPFVVREEARHRLFFEDYDPRAGRGVIATAEIGPDGRAGPARIALARPYHLSYPQVLRDGGDLLMLPETERNHSIELYRASGVDGWELDRTLMKGVRAVDNTLLRRDGHWWLFTNLYDERTNPWDELFLFSADVIDGPWTPHPLNPVVSDARRARPAGSLFVHGGELIRPGQDCTGSYGRRVVLSRVEVLTANDYAETPIGSIEPHGLRGAQRTHTYSRDGDCEAIDAYRPRWRGLR